MEASVPSHRIRFGKFEVDLESGELFKDGRPIRLQGQPIQILLMLLEKSGRIVTREELQKRLWPGDTFVDFDHSLNAAIQRLREALNDPVDTPRYIETLPRRGYRFIFPIEAPQEETKEKLGSREGDENRRIAERGKWERAVWIGVAATLVLAVGMSGWVFYSRRSVAPPLKVRKFTSLPGIEDQPAFSPDGNQVAFCWKGGKQDNWDIYVQIIDGGKPMRLTFNPSDDFDPTWSPDGLRIAFNRYEGRDCEILTIPAIGGAERSLGKGAGGKMSWSPDGRFLATTERSSTDDTSRICLVSMETGERQRLTSPTPGVTDMYPIFSPDGKSLVFRRRPIATTMFWTAGLYVLPLVNGRANGEPRLLTLERSLGDFDWMPDGHGLVFSSSRSGVETLWKIALTGGEATPLAGLPGDVSWGISISRKGNRLMYAKYEGNMRIFRISGEGLQTRTPTTIDSRPIPLTSSTQVECDP